MSDAERVISKYSRVNAAGRIVATLSTNEIAAAEMIANGALPEGEYLVALDGDPATQWYDGEGLQDRPENPSRVENNIVVDIPVPSFVWAFGERYEVVDGTFELDTDEPGPIRVEIQSFPFKDTAVYLESN